MSGHIYIATNAGLRGLVKIGFTTQSPAKRVAQFSTGAPHPFVLAYCAPVANPRRIEQAVHAYLAPKRVNKGREFFAVTVEQAINTIRSLSEEVRRRDALAAAEAKQRDALAAAEAKRKRQLNILDRLRELERLAVRRAEQDRMIEGMRQGCERLAFYLRSFLWLPV
jgi:hypothetical protein